MAAYTDEQVKYIAEKMEEGLYWDEIATVYNETYGTKKSGNAIRKTMERFSATMQSELISEDTLVKNLKTTYTARKNASKARKENKVLLENQLTLEDLLVEFKKIIKKQPKVKVGKPKKSKKTKMVVEAMLSDVHFGLKTKTYDTNVARNRLSYYSQTVLKEIARKEKLYTIDSIHVPLMGDFIQSESMHSDSSASCDLTNAEQIAVAIESIFYDFVLPLAKTGYKVNITGVCGNHDREASNQFTVNPGRTYYTFTMYRMIQLLCEQAGLKNVSIDIPDGVYRVVEILGKNFLYEHGHTVKGSKIDSLEKHLIKRQAQVEKILSGVRIGHYHNDVVSSMGRHIINGSSVSDDHYGDLLGYKSRPCQVLNFYVDCKRDTSFFHAITVDLSEIK